MTAFLFDLDGVICRNRYFTSALEQEHGIPHARWGNFFEARMPECVIGRRDLKEELAALLPQLGWTASVDALLSFWFERERSMCPEILKVVTDLRGLKNRCYVATNQERYRTAYLRNAMRLEDRFDDIYSSCELGAAKPSTNFYARVESLLGTSDICLVDDSPANILAAEKFRWKTVHYRRVEDIMLIWRCRNSPVQAAISNR